MPASHSPVPLPCLQSNALPSHVKISVSRQTLFEDSFQQVGRCRGRGAGQEWSCPSGVELAPATVTLRCSSPDHEHEAVRPAAPAVHHHARGGGPGLRWHCQVSVACRAMGPCPASSLCPVGSAGMSQLHSGLPVLEQRSPGVFKWEIGF